MGAALLVELLTEELPPRSLRALGEAFAAAIANGLAGQRLAAPPVAGTRAFATPRRLGALIPDVRAKADDRQVEVSGPAVKIGLDAQGKPTPALIGFARKAGVPLESLEQRDGPKGRVFVARTLVAGSVLDEVLAAVVQEALKKLPVAKLMRWGDGDAQFVRPVHRLLMLHGARIVPGSVLGLASGNLTRGHRFMSAGDIAIAEAGEYEGKLKSAGRVIPDFDERKASIEKALIAEAGRLGAGLGDYADTLEEVAALVEHPSVYAGAFDTSFLEVPQECLILTMRQNQKYFPLFDASGRLSPQFLIVSNMRVADPRPIVAGNQRVVRPRLEDARFFYQQDLRVRLEGRVPQLAKMVYHNQLGSQLERVERIQLLAGAIAREIGANAERAERAAWLAKADLLTGMVGEFPELQGIMGRYYALHDGEPPEVADAIEAHYRPRFAGDALPRGAVACAVALADKLDALAGLFGIGQQPSGDKDPFGLRRAALGVIRILIEQSIRIPLDRLVNAAFQGFDRKVGDTRTDVETFIYERARGYLLELGYTANEVEAVLCLRPVNIDLLRGLLQAVREFSALPEAESLAAANKRIANILRQAQSKGESYANADASALTERAEVSLHDALRNALASAQPCLDAGDFAGYLKTFASLKQPVDQFFDTVLVMAEDRRLRQNRLALLADMRRAMNRVADISKLAA
ncbi:MAG: glycine--tRNA ligase subunit beta [Betaproteobacteria bacterium]|nr:glycine--tRNA ligase subunit beta [Betaproteobacteria bacterium]